MFAVNPLRHKLGEVLVLNHSSIRPKFDIQEKIANTLSS